MRILVIGATGLTGRRIVSLLHEGPHEPVAMVRDPERKGDFEAEGIETVVADLEAPMDDAVRGCDAIVFAAGSGSKTGPDKTLAVDRDGAIRTIAAMEATGVDRFVMLSSFRADSESEGHRISHYLRAKGIADEHLRRSDLAYTIVRPGRLTEEAGAGKVHLAENLDGSGSISRDDLAEVLVRCLDLPNTIGKSFDLLGGEEPIEEALARI